MIKKNITTILKEINTVLRSVDDYQVNLAIKEITRAKKIVLGGVGRVGLVARALATRLVHLGLEAYCIGDSNLPAIDKKDLLIVCSGSGETQTIYDLAQLAKKQGSKLLLISSYIDHYKSPMAKIADVVVIINAPSKVRQIKGFSSIQPMTTLNEQCLFIFFDALVLLLMKKLHKTSKDMWKKHSNLE